jgi:hypothetical protein
MRGLPAVGLLVLLASLAVPSPASAWTDATVRTASADIALTPDGRARVALRARVRVDGGWLEGLDVEGLDADAQLDADAPPVFRDANGVALPVEVTARAGGRVGFRFARRAAPRRGEYELELAWFTSLADGVTAREDGTLRARWVFPAWRYGLDGVEIRWLVPAGARSSESAEALSPVELEEVATDGPTALGARRITFRRAHLPRTSDWVTSVDVPASAWPHVSPVATDRAALEHGAPGDVSPGDESPEGAPLARVQGEDGARSGPPSRASAASPPDAPDVRALLALLIALGAWLKRRDLEARAVSASAVHEPLLPAPRVVATLASMALAAAAVASRFLIVPPAALVGLAALVVGLGWQKRQLGAARPRMHALAPLRSRHVVAARREAVLGWLAPGGWLEPARLGVPATLGALALAWDADGPSRALAALFAALVASGSRARLGPCMAARLRTLASAAEALRVELDPPHLSFALLGRGGSRSADAPLPHDVRLRVQPVLEGRLARQLEQLGIEVLPDDRGGLSLRLSAREETPADLALRAWAEHAGHPLDETTRRTTVELAVERSSIAARLREAVVGIARLAPRERDATVDDLALEQPLADAAE